MLPVSPECSPTATQQWGEPLSPLFGQAWSAWLRTGAEIRPVEEGYKTQAAIREKSAVLRGRIDATRKNQVSVDNLVCVLCDLDAHLGILAKSMALFDGDAGFQQIIEMSLPQDFLEKMPALLKDICSGDEKALQTLDYLFVERAIAEIVFKNMASLGLWRSIVEAKKSREVFYKEHEEDPRAFVGAVAIGWRGEIIATAYRGEGGHHLKMHAEDVLIKKLREAGKLEEVCLVATNLEPCKERNPHHWETLGHGDGCSTLLIKAGIPAVAFLQVDEHEHGRGRGAGRLHEHGMPVFTGQDPTALLSAAVIQIYAHLNGKS
jgi:pyrimidine deaminase RibD-like protein